MVTANPEMVLADHHLQEFLSRVHPDGERFECRILFRGRKKGAHHQIFNSVDSAVKWVHAQEERLGDSIKGCYVTLNPLHETAVGAAKDTDIAARRWILIDVDPERASGVSATDEEKASALGLIDRVVEKYLVGGRKWPRPLAIDSGNGCHGLYELADDFPLNDVGDQLIKDFLHALDGEFSTGQAKIDETVCNRSRITKLPGTWTRKGADSSDRPWRKATLMNEGEKRTISVKDIKSVISDLRQDSVVHLSDWATPAGVPDGPDDFQKSLSNDLSTPEETPTNIALLKGMLKHVHPDDKREPWRNNVWAIVSLGWECGEQIAREWSSKSERYDADKFGVDVASYDPNRPKAIKIGTLVKNAQDGGYNGAVFASQIQPESGDKSGSEAVPKGWHIDAWRLPTAAERETVLKAVHAQSGVGITALREDLKAGEKIYKRRQKKNDTANDGLLTVDYQEYLLPEVVEQIREKLASREDTKQLFSAGGSVVEIALQRSGSGFSARQLLIHILTVPEMQSRILEDVGFIQDDARTGCPKIVGENLVQAEPTWLPRLNGFIEHPIVQADGTVSTQSGFDPSTGLYTNFSESLVKYVQPDPRKQDAENALEYIEDEVLAEFPFADDRNRTAAVSLFLTALTRRTVGIAPGFMVNAGGQQVGKTTLINMVFQIVFGRDVAPAAWSDNSEETSKHLLGILGEGQPGVLFDNLKDGSTIDNVELSKLLSSLEYTGRKLGQNKTLRYSAQILVCLTGNRISLARDMTSRLVPITMDIRPRAQKYTRQDLRGWCFEHRPKALASLMTILQAHRAAVSIGLASSLPDIPSRFPEWDQQVRAPLEWLGRPDISDLFLESEDGDIDYENRATFLACWDDLHGTKRVAARDITQYIKAPRSTLYGMDHSKYEDDKLEAFSEAITNVFPPTTSYRQNAPEISFGKMLKRDFLNAPYGQRVLRKTKKPATRDRIHMYWVDSVSVPKSPDAA